jgi:hypothetical protein
MTLPIMDFIEVLAKQNSRFHLRCGATPDMLTELEITLEGKIGGEGGRRMKWLKRLLHKPFCSSSTDGSDLSRQEFHDFGGRIGRLPVRTPPHLVRLHVTAGEGILLDDQPIALPDLEQSLKAACKAGTVVYYSRDNPEQESQFGGDVIKCVCRLGLPIAFPPEATPVIDRIYSQGQTKHGGSHDLGI